MKTKQIEERPVQFHRNPLKLHRAADIEFKKDLEKDFKLIVRSQTAEIKEPKFRQFQRERSLAVKTHHPKTNLNAIATIKKTI